MRRGITTLAVFALALCLADRVAAGPYEDGQAAYESEDYAMALRFWRPLADQGDAAAQHKLGNVYRLGQSVPKDPTEAARWYRKSADQGHARAQYRLAWMYIFGQGVPQSDAEAAKWYRKAAEQGDADGQLVLGSMYHEAWLVAQDYAEALKWYRKAADQGNAGESGSTRTPFPAQGGQQSGDCGQQVMAA